MGDKAREIKFVKTTKYQGPKPKTCWRAARKETQQSRRGVVAGVAVGGVGTAVVAVRVQLVCRSGRVRRVLGGGAKEVEVVSDVCGVCLFACLRARVVRGCFAPGRC